MEVKYFYNKLLEYFNSYNLLILSMKVLSLFLCHKLNVSSYPTKDIFMFFNFKNFSAGDITRIKICNVNLE